MSFLDTARRLLRLVRVHRAFTAMFLLGLASIVLNVLGPVLLGRATDLVVAGLFGGRAEPGTSKAEVVEGLRANGHDALANVVAAADVVPGHGIDLTAVGATLLVALAVYAVSGGCWILQGRQATSAIQDAASRLRAEAAAKLNRLPVTHFETTGRGELLSRVTNDIDNVVTSLQQTMSQLTNSALLIIGLLVMMFLSSPLLAVIALVVVPAAALVTTMLGKRAAPEFRRQWTATGTLTSHVEETYTGHALVTAYDRREPAVAAFREHNDAVFRAAYRAQFLSGSSQPAMNFVNNLGFVAIAVVGCLRVAAGGLTVGALQAFVQYSRQLSGPLTQVTGLVGIVQSGVASARRVFELLDADEEDATGQDAALPAPVRGRIRFESVRFRYQQDKPLIDDLTLTVAPGRTVAIVGHTGAGKTTLVNLLLRFHEVAGGRITVDDVDIATVPRSGLRANIGVVPQDPWLFTGTVAENIGYGRPAAPRAEIEAAARATHADHVVRTLPDGYDTVLDEDGTTLSGGERQLIAIARAFLVDPPILVLDEATSSVDTRTELLVRRAMQRLRAGRTSFVIAHRLSTIRDADTIVVMREGAIVESGMHDELLAADGAYAALHRAQFAAHSPHATVPLRHLPLRAGAARYALRGETPGGAPADVVARVREIALSTPDTVAVVEDERTVSYRALWERVRRIRYRLLAQGCAPGDLVGVLGPRAVDTIAAFLAIGSLGAVYLPLDPAVPAARTAAVLGNAEPRCVLVHGNGVTRADVPVVELPGADGPMAEDVAPYRFRDDEPRYVIHTSGSTGRPKGVLVPESGLANHLRSMTAVLALGPSDVVAFTAPTTYVISIWQLVAALLAGGRVAVIPDRDVLFGRRLVAAVARTGVTVLELVPAAVGWLVEERRRRPDLSRLPRLRHLLSTGERLAPELAADALHAYPDVVLVNAYGATECADDVSLHVVTTADVDGSPLPAGVPLPGVALYVLVHDDGTWRAAEPGEAGELWVGGAGVALGYLNEPALTRAAFFADDLDPGSPTNRLYRTGDLAVVDDGRVRCLGRADRQVKVAGVRTELDEVEAAIATLPGVTGCAVVVDGTDEQAHLVAYVTADEQAPTASLATAVREHLPRGMVPRRWTRLDALPRNASGKVDYQALRSRPGG